MRTRPIRTFLMVLQTIKTTAMFGIASGLLWSQWLQVILLNLKLLVGFGDFYPVTHIGRFIIVLSCFWGMFMVSQFVYTLQISSEFNLAE